MSGDQQTQEFAAFLAGQARRDEENLQRAVGVSEDEIKRRRAASVLGTDDDKAAALRAAILRRKARDNGALSRPEVEQLLAAEILSGQRSEIAVSLAQAARESGSTF